MNSDTITITTQTLKSLPKVAQDAIVLALFGQQKVSDDPAHVLEEADESLAQLSPSQARDFYNGCGEKTRKAIEVIARSESAQFHLKDVAEAIGVKPAELSHVWGGLTRRLTTITGNGDSILINWERHEGVFDADGEYLDHIGEVSELTYQSFRKMLAK